MKTLTLLLALATGCLSQTVTCTVPTPNGSQVLQRMNLTIFGWTCEPVTADPTAVYSRDANGNLHLGGGTPVVYSVIFNAEYKSSGSVEPNAPVGSLFNGLPASAFDGQTVWCINKAQNAGTSVITANQLATIQPVVLVEIRQGTGFSKITSTNVAWPPPTRWKWNPTHPNCQGTPGITFAKGSDLMYQDNNTTASAPLLQMWVVSMVPQQ